MYCFSFCIQLSLSQFSTNLPTTAIWWKRKFSQQISYHITSYSSLRFAGLLLCISLQSLRLITFCVQSVQNTTNFPHPQPCNPNRLGGLQLGPCLSLDNSRQFSCLYRHTRDHILSARIMLSSGGNRINAYIKDHKN